MHYRDQVGSTECEASDERVNTLQELRFGTKESRQGLAVSDSRYLHVSCMMPQRQIVEKVQKDNISRPR